MSKGPLKVDPQLGDIICTILEKETGEQVHIILCILPMDGDMLGQPSFITSLDPEVMEHAMIDIAATMPSPPGSMTMTGRFDVGDPPP